MLTMQTRKQPQKDYHLMNGGSDEEAPPEDRLSRESSVHTVSHDQEIQNDTQSTFQLQHASQAKNQDANATEEADRPAPSRPSPWTIPSQNKRTATATAWFWNFFEVTTVNREWYKTKNGKAVGKKHYTDRDIFCTLTDKKTKTRCSYDTSDSRRHNNTTNMERHLEKQHDIHPPQADTSQSASAGGAKQPDIRRFYAGPQPSNHLTHQQRLQQNVRNLIVKNMLPFRIVEDQAFRKVFEDASMLEPPFANGRHLKKNIQEDFITTREALKGELKESCSSISLSVDVWTSPNQLSILGVVGHWLTPNFEYKEKLLEFAELPESESGDDMALMLDGTLVELGLEEKLVAITGDNASNNGRMADQLETILANRSAGRSLRFQGSQSYIRYFCVFILLYHER